MATCMQIFEAIQQQAGEGKLQSRPQQRIGDATAGWPCGPCSSWLYSTSSIAWPSSLPRRRVASILCRNFMICESSSGGIEGAEERNTKLGLEVREEARKGA
ncbi:hypothetical protein SETIT_4G245100v2 [Setaria italica]|uniref:Uncharacterized protein n=1 Tax=Setaria italica TaxID=4555 RepID=A0A368QZP9_SETIT|nr:hypothetical protein SETIT_4G245100v2 [Setaria italica]